jgi:hypothetical protein
MLIVVAIFVFLYVILTAGVLGYQIGFYRGQMQYVDRLERLLDALNEADECERLAEECEALADRAAEVNYPPEVFEKLRSLEPKTPDVAYPEDDDL